MNIYLLYIINLWVIYNNKIIIELKINSNIYFIRQNRNLNTKRINDKKISLFTKVSELSKKLP